MSLPYLQATRTLVTLNQNLQLGSNVTMLDNAGRVMWVPGSTVQWQPTPAPPALTPPTAGYAFAAGAGTAATYRWIGNEIVVNVSVTGTVSAVDAADRASDYTLSVPYPVAAAAAPVIVGDLWLSVTTGGNTFSFKAYARTIVANPNALTVRFLSGSTDDTLASIDAGSALTLQGTLVYATTMVNNGTTLTQPYSLPAAFRQNQGGQVILDGSGIGIQPRGQLDVATASNVPALVVDQRSGAGSDVLNCLIGGVKSVVVDGSGRLGIGTAAPASNLHVVGSALVTGNLTVQGSNINTFNITTQTEINSSNVVINNAGSGPALSVTQQQGTAQPVAQFVAGTSNALYVAASGYVGIGTTNPQANLHVNGVLYCPGCIVQIAQTQTSSYILGTTNSTYTNTTLAVSITPKFASSLMLITACVSLQTANADAYLSIFKNGSQLDDNNTRYYAGTGIVYTPASLSWKETAGNTTLRTYAVYAKAGGGGTIYIGNTGSCSIYVQEIAQ